MKHSARSILSGMLVFTMFLSTFCISLSGFDGQRSSWFDTMTVLLAEEEGGESETEVNHWDKNLKELHSFQYATIVFLLTDAGLEAFDTVPYRSLCLDVLSPPPEA